MTKKLLLSFFVVLCFSVGYGQTAATSDSKLLTEKIDAKQWRAYVATAYPENGSPATFFSGYKLQLSGDSVIASLPYIGKSLSGKEAYDGLIEIAAIADNYKVKYKKKDQTWQINFAAESNTGEHFDFLLRIASDGAIFFEVTSKQRAAIAYDGRISYRK